MQILHTPVSQKALPSAARRTIEVTINRAAIGKGGIASQCRVVPPPIWRPWQDTAVGQRRQHPVVGAFRQHTLAPA